MANGIHILSRYYDEVLQHPDVSSVDAVSAAMQEMWQPVVFTSLTTAAGFLSFLTPAFSRSAILHLYCHWRLGAAMVFSITLFPALLSLLPVKVSRGLRAKWAAVVTSRRRAGRHGRLSRLGVGVARKPLVVWGVTTSVMLVCLLGAQRIFVDTSFIKMSDPNSPVRIADTILGETFQGNLPLYIALEGHQPDLLKDPVLLTKLDRLQTVVEQDPIVGGSLSLAEYIKRMNRVMNEDRLEMEAIPDSQDLVAQYLLLYSFSGDPDDFDEIVDYDYQHANMTIFLRSDSTQDIERVVGIVQDFAIREFGYAGGNAATDTGSQDPLSIRFGRWLAGIEPTVIGWETNSGFRLGIAGNGYLTTRFSELVVSGQLASLVVSLVAVFLLTAFMFRSWVAGVINIIPISLVMVFSFGLLGLLGIPLEVGKSLTASMVIGIGIDYTIHFLNKYRIKIRSGLTDPEEITAATMATSGKSIFFNAFVVTASFLVFLTSNFRPNFYLGAMLSLNMGACLLVSMTVLPAILNTFKPRFVYGEKTALVGTPQPSVEGQTA